MKIGIQMGKMGLLASLLLVFVYCLNFTESKRSKSACYYYGHSCWGGHGKRSGNEGLLPASRTANKISGYVSSPVLQLLMKNRGNPNSIESLLPGREEASFGPDPPLHYKNSKRNIIQNLQSDDGKNSNGKFADEVNDDKGGEEVDDPTQDSELVPLSVMQNKRGNEAEVVGNNDRLGSDYDSAVGNGNSMNSMNMNRNSGATEEEVPIYYPSSSAAASSEIFSRNNRIRDRVGNHNNVKDKTSGKSPGGNMILLRWLPVQKNM